MASFFAEISAHREQLERQDERLDGQDEWLKEHDKQLERHSDDIEHNRQQIRELHEKGKISYWKRQAIVYWRYDIGLLNL